MTPGRQANYMKRGGEMFSAKSGGKRIKSVRGLVCKWFGKVDNLGGVLLAS